MAAKNDITGDSIQTRGTTEAYRDNYDLIFGKKDKNADKKETENTNDQLENQPDQE